MPRKKTTGSSEVDDQDIAELVCEWGDCEQTFSLHSCFSEFRAHVEGHIRTLLPSYSSQHSTDPIPRDFECPWRECGWLNPKDTDELIRHFLFHVVHTRLKTTGRVRLESGKFNKCVLEAVSRNLVPDVPEKFLCEWMDCNLQFNCPSRFYEHVESHVMSVDKERIVNGGRKTTHVTCQWTGCLTSVRNHCKLREHAHVHTREKVYACHVCGGMFASMSKFADHLSRQNTSEFETFQCSHCLKYCGSQRILRDHMRHHVNNIKCEFCDMTCPNPSALKQHIKFRHSTLRPYVCDVCDYSCKTCSDLRRHRESHNAVFSYTCAVQGCAFSARAMQTLKRHFKITHEGGELAKYECHLCGARYTRGTGLTSHLKAKHKFRWPAGHPRFRYKEHEDGIWRLQTVRFESVQLSQQLSEKQRMEEEEDEDNLLEAVDGYEPASEPSSPGSELADQNEVNTASEEEGEDDGEEESEEGQETGEGSEGEQVDGTMDRAGYQYLLMQYENHEQELINSETHFPSSSKELAPIRKERQSRRGHPYDRPASPADHLDVSRTLLALQEAALRLANMHGTQ